MKRILDSVHGYICIPRLYMDKIVDSIYFQRLRRIEQTSCRVIFPCARHDRFVHSLGVFYLGDQIAYGLWRKRKLLSDNGSPFDEERLASLIVTYRLACLLHDVGHTPFSHTFEEFFNNNENNLVARLANLIPNDTNFTNDFNTQFKRNEKLQFAPHELLSAIIAIEQFGEDVISQKCHSWGKYECCGDIALLARMIVGCKYQGDKEFCIENAFIDLIHGDIIDADGLDYVCRDVWASGYATSKIDVSRLIDAILICRNHNDFFVCYDVKAISDVRSVLQVKTFQNNVVFKHHMVALEQYMLVEAMKTAAMGAMSIQRQEGEDIEVIRKQALKKLCKIELFTKDGLTLGDGTHIRMLMDDDFVSLLKSHIDQGRDIEQWLSRSYDYIPVWRLEEELLSQIPDTLKEDMRKFPWLISSQCKDLLLEQYGIQSNQVLLIRANGKNYETRIKDASIYVYGKVVKYNQLYPEKEVKEEQDMLDTGKQNKKETDFYYLFIPKKYSEQVSEIQQKLVEGWTTAYETKKREKEQGIVDKPARESEKQN